MPNNQHHALEPRIGDGLLAERQALHARRHAERGADRRRPSRAGCGIDPKNVVLISRVHRRRVRQQGHRRGACTIPALLSKKAERAGDDAHHPRGRALHRRRPPGLHGASRSASRKDGRIIALDLFVVGENSAYEAQGDAAQRRPDRVAAVSAGGDAVARRSRCSPTRRRGARRASRAACRASRSMEPVIAKAARKLEHRSGRDPPDQRARGQGAVRPGRAAAASAATPPSAFVKEALDAGAELFNWDERKARSGQRDGIEGARRRRGGQHVRRRLDRLRRPVRHQAGRQDVRPVRHRQPRHRIGDRRPPRRRRDAGHAVGEVRGRLGRHRKNLPWTCVSGGSQTTHADDARGARGGDGRE